MDKFDYENITNKIKILEIKIKRINLTKDYLTIIKPTPLNFKKRKIWNEKFKTLLKKEDTLYTSLQLAYQELEKLFT